MTGSRRPGRSLALAAGLVVLVACGDTKKGPPIGGGDPGKQDNGGQYQEPTGNTPTDNTTPTTPAGGDDGGPIIPPRHPESWAPPATALESVAQLTHYWVEERFDWNDDHSPVRLDRQLDVTKLAKAAVDECFIDIGDSQLPVDGACSSGIPKKNQSYVWGLTRTGRDLWFGTVANVVCQVALGWIVPDDANVVIKNDYFVCEGVREDFRPPHLYRFNLDEMKLYDLEPGLGAAAIGMLRSTAGIRSAGEADGVVFLAGPSALGGGLNVFAFDADTKESIGARNLPDYSDIRTWVKANGVLYAGVGNTLPQTPDEADASAVKAACDASATPCPELPAGSILRWIGNRADPFHFEIVGVMDNEAANMAFHDGRLFVTTWPSFFAGNDLASARPAGLWMSPLLGACGLTIADAGDWKEIWSMAEYDPDPVARATTGGGAIASFNGKLYWGTMSVPFLATSLALQLNAAGKLCLDANCDNAITADEMLATALGSHRSVAVFTLQGSAMTPPPADQPAQDPPVANCPAPYWIELLFGERYLPRYDADRKMYTIVADDAHENPAGLKPVKGSSGFGNFFNNYVWSMAVYRDALYIGTFDWSQVARVTLQGILSQHQPPTLETASFDGTIPPADGVDGEESPIERFLEHVAGQLGDRIPQEGGDLIRVECDGNVNAETFTGLENDTNYGFRTMVTDDEALYIGTANAMNLHPNGGWELLKLTPQRSCGEPPPEDVAQ